MMILLKSYLNRIASLAKILSSCYVFKYVEHGYLRFVLWFVL